MLPAARLYQLLNDRRQTIAAVRLFAVQVPILEALHGDRIDRRSQRLGRSAADIRSQGAGNPRPRPE